MRSVQPKSLADALKTTCKSTNGSTRRRRPSLIFRHRALRHHAQGIFECERIFGVSLVNSDGKTVPVRYIGEQHVKEDCGGFIPTVADWFRNVKREVWMSRGYEDQWERDKPG